MRLWGPLWSARRAHWEILARWALSCTLAESTPLSRLQPPARETKQLPTRNSAHSEIVLTANFGSQRLQSMDAPGRSNEQGLKQALGFRQACPEIGPRMAGAWPPLLMSLLREAGPRLTEELVDS